MYFDLSRPIEINHRQTKGATEKERRKQSINEGRRLLGSKNLTPIQINKNEINQRRRLFGGKKADLNKYCIITYLFKIFKIRSECNLIYRNS